MHTPVSPERLDTQGRCLMLRPDVTLPERNCWFHTGPVAAAVATWSAPRRPRSARSVSPRGGRGGPRGPACGCGGRPMAQVLQALQGLQELQGGGAEGAAGRGINGCLEAHRQGMTSSEGTRGRSGRVAHTV